ncbi:MAG: hypothetical protein D6679_04125 [Candidatus Hydrogenedentota bacterium]|nr:MAG: hypothetical protein D6679_04125 [Candidatus Hydrogenedentota bacterium]
MPRIVLKTNRCGAVFRFSFHKKHTLLSSPRPIQIPLHSSGFPFSRFRTLLLTLVFSTAVSGCGGSTSPSSRSSSASSLRAATTSFPAVQEESDSVPALPALPEKVGSWTISERRTFESESLSELIDGAADAYLSLGFRKADYAVYSHPGGFELEVMRFEMTSPAAAHGALTRDAAPDDQRLPFGTEAYQGPQMIAARRGQYYTRIQGFDDRDEVYAGMSEIARAVLGLGSESSR